MQVAQFWPGFDAKLADQQLAGPVVGRQGLGRAAAPVQGQHELCVEPLAEWLLGGEGLQLEDQVGMPGRDSGRHRPAIQRLQAQLLQARPGVAPQHVRRDIGQRFAPPQRQRLGEDPGRLRPVGHLHRFGALPGQAAEPEQVRLVLADPEQIARDPGLRSACHPQDREAGAGI